MVALTHRAKWAFLEFQVGQPFQEFLVGLVAAIGDPYSLQQTGLPGIPGWSTLPGVPGWAGRVGARQPYSSKRVDLPGVPGWSTVPGVPGRAGIEVVVEPRS